MCINSHRSIYCNLDTHSIDTQCVLILIDQYIVILIHIPTDQCIVYLVHSPQYIYAQMRVHTQRRTYTPHVPLYTTSLYIDGCIICIFYYLTRMHSKYSPPYIRTSARTHMDIYTPCTCIHHTSFILMNVFSVFSTFLQLHI